MDSFNKQRTEVDDLWHESRSFDPPQIFKIQANVKDPSIYQQAKEDPLKFWEECARRLHWYKPWNKVLEWNKPFAKWFLGGKLNASYNCLDRHIKAHQGNKVAIYWEGENGNVRVLSYQDVYEHVNKMANAIKDLGVKKGDRVAIYLPMIPEAIFAMLACSRIGAVHTVVFGGFSSEA
ncbi:MAG: acetyl-coenzyme A synthetase N-terminal domain-containing protein, partial [Candidatus Omnitrophota bacterium]